MSNWKKVLFEGGNFVVNAITASEVPILTADGAGGTGVFTSDFTVVTGFTGSGAPATDPFRFRSISQNNLNTLQGDTIFTIKGGANAQNGTSDFQSNGDALVLTTDNTDYLNVRISDSDGGLTGSIGLTPGTSTLPYLSRS